MNKFFRIAALAGMLLPQLCGAAVPDVTVTASPREFRAGGMTRVSITLGGELRADGLKLPKVNGAEWRTDRVARSTSVRIVNGRHSRSETYTLPLAASTPGELVIPAFEVRFADGKTARSEPVKLTVLAPGEKAKTAVPEPSGRIVVTAKRDRFYVGEGVPVALELTIPGGMRLADLGFPRLECDGPMVMSEVAGGDSRHPH